MIWGYSWLRIQNIVGLAGRGFLQVMLLGWRIKVQPGVGGQCVLGESCLSQGSVGEVTAWIKLEMSMNEWSPGDDSQRNGASQAET